MTSVMTPPEASEAPAGEVSRALHFVEPLPGFDGEDAYTLSGIDPDGVLFAMRSVKDPALRFVLTPAEVFFGDYHPELGDVVTQAVGSDADTDLRLLLILTIGSGLADATANLRAPIVVSASTGQAMQVVLDDESLSMRAPLIESEVGPDL